MSKLKMLDCVLQRSESNHGVEGVRMAQGVLSYQYEEDSSDSGMTGWAGLPLFLDLAQAAGLWDAISRHLHVRARRRGGW